MAEQPSFKPAQTNGCSWGRETRVMVNNIRDSVTEIKESIKDQGTKLDVVVETTAGKPSWFVTGVISALCALCVGLITYIVTCQRPDTIHTESDTHLVSINQKSGK